ncbi:MAG: hypothetical protein QOE07_1098 [Acidimicrobiaceae bacterium]|jgi:hypothetical protein|nr:hypothetical protein [Acidimicrobiaceae bacterium]MDQ1412510.1 hypothetical protein [Acidimicrobiaceae bacterium]MDQ1415221.1 hypothetical protein [Acidimicrobiaceae bacterium]
MHRPTVGDTGVKTSLEQGAPSYETAVGVTALTANTTGIYNSAFGAGALSHNATGSSNTAVGCASNVTNTSGSGNTAVGAFALSTTGNNNTAVGADAYTGGSSSLPSTGNNNSCLGAAAFYALQAGSENSALGTSALHRLTSGSDNVGVGFGALSAVTQGSLNTAVGAYAGLSVSGVGTGHVMIGYGAGAFPGAAAHATTTAANQTLLGTETGNASGAQPDNVTAVGYQALVDGHYATAIGSTTLAGAAGAVAIGCDSTGAGASTTTLNEIKLGTTRHTANIPGALRVGNGVGLWGHATPATQPATPASLADVIAVLQGYGLTA